MKQYDGFTCEFKDHIATITNNRPPLNLLLRKNFHDLMSIMTELEEIEDLYCVIITSVGDRSFCAGDDVSEVYENETIDELDAVEAYNRKVYTRLANFPCPTIAAINGYALGGGMEMALACDIIIASDNAKLGLPETKLGFIAGLGGSQRMPRRVGIAEAKLMAFTSEKLTAEEAYRIGLVQQVVPLDELQTAARDLAEKICSNSPYANRWFKKCINQYANLGIMEGLEFEGIADRMTLMSEDAIEGPAALLEKRTPNWKGR